MKPGPAAAVSREHAVRVPESATRRRRGALPPAAVLISQAVAGAALVFGSSAVFGWAGRAVLAPGPWLGADLAAFRALNGIALPGLSAVLFATLNDPGLDYFALILALLAYCAWRQRALVPAAALAVGVALALNNAFTQPVHHAGVRARPFAQVAEARTPVMACGGVGLVAMRGAEAAVAPCGDPAAGEAPASGALRGVDWREIWSQFPSYPSGHMREAVALAVLLVAFWRRSWPYVLGLMALLGFSRVHLGAHYPTDVLGGAVMGLSSGVATALALDLLRRTAVALHGVPAVARAWDWVARPRVPGRPALDPWPARAIRVAAVVAVVHATLWGLGFAATSPGASHVHSVLQGVDERAFHQVTARFDPAVAGPLYVLLGPAGLLYAALAVAALALAWRADRGRLPAAVATLLLALAFALELSLVGGHLFQRPQPFAQVEGTPIPPQWQALWASGSSFPSRHTLLVAALAGLVGVFGRAYVVAGHALALAAAATALYFGAAWVADALAGYVAGFAAAIGARYAVLQVGPDAAAPEGAAGAAAVPEQPPAAGATAGAPGPSGSAARPAA